MNISDKNLLEIIAKFIPDKQTFLNFALVSKNASIIAKKLTITKKEEFERIDFIVTIDNEYGDFLRTSCEWQGKYTKGSITSIGTIVYLISKELDIVYDENFSLEKFKFDDVNLKLTFPTYNHFREEYLSDIIEGLEGQNKEVCEIIMLSEMEKYKGNFLVTCWGTNIWFIKNLQTVIKELNRVLSFCIENNVTFEWV